MFEIQQDCILEQCIGGRGNNEESEPWINLRFSFDDLPCEAVAAVLDCKAGGSGVQEAFFDDEGRNRFPGMDMVKVGRRFENTHSIRISGGPKLHVDALLKIKLTPYGKNTFSGQFQVTIKEVPEGFYDAMFSKVHSSMKVNLIQDKTELFDNNKEHAQVKKAEPKQATLQ